MASGYFVVRPPPGGVTGGFWTTILEAEVSHKSLLALLYCILERQKQRQVDRTAAVCAAQLYLTLLQIPGQCVLHLPIAQGDSYV